MDDTSATSGTTLWIAGCSKLHMEEVFLVISTLRCHVNKIFSLITLHLGLSVKYTHIIYKFWESLHLEPLHWEVIHCMLVLCFIVHPKWTWSPLWGKTPLKSYPSESIPVCVIVNDWVTLCHVFTSDSQIFLLKAIIGHGFLLIPKSDFIIFSWENYSLYTLKKELLTWSMLDLSSLINLNIKGDF